MSKPHQPALPDVEQASQPITFTRTAVLAGLAVAVAFLLLFAWLADEVFEGDAVRFDSAVRGWIHGLASPTLTTVMRMLSALGSPLLLGAVAVSIAVFLLLRWKRAAIWMTVAMAGALVLDLTLKAGFHRTRPEPFFGSLPHTYSFPSGHSLFSLCFYGVLAGLLTARIRSLALRIAIWTVAAALVVAIGVSRIYLGVHYPTDVVAGYLSAAMWVAALVTADRARRRHRSRKGGPRSR